MKFLARTMGFDRDLLSRLANTLIFATLHQLRRNKIHIANMTEKDYAHQFRHFDIDGIFENHTVRLIGCQCPRRNCQVVR